MTALLATAPQQTLHTLAGLSQAASVALLSSAWQAGLLVAGVALLLRAFPGIDAAKRSAAWTLVLLISLLLPFAPGVHTIAVAPAPLHLDPRWSYALAALWLMLSLLRAVNLGRSALSLHRLWTRANPLPGQSPASRSRAPRHAVLCTSNDVKQPSVIGFLAPRILIPTALYQQLSAADLEQIVLHEAEHLRRRDDWTNLLQKIALVFFPLNPALLWVERRLCLERELACDERVLQTTHAPKSYAACLVHLAENRAAGPRLSLALGAWERRPELARRIHEILTRRGQRMSRAQAAAFSLFLGAGVLAGAMALSATPQLVCFTSQPVSLAQSATGPSILQRTTYRATTAQSESHAATPHLTLALAKVPPSSGDATNLPAARIAPRRAAFPRVHTERAPLPSSPRPLTVPRRLLLSSWEVRQPRPGGPFENTAEAGANNPHPPDRGDPSSFTLTLFQTTLQRTPHGPKSLSTYAAVPTPSGWLIFEL